MWLKNRQIVIKLTKLSQKALDLLMKEVKLMKKDQKELYLRNQKGQINP